MIGRDEAEVRARLGWFRGHLEQSGVSAAKAMEQTESLMRQPLVGTIEQIVDTLHGLRAQGMTYAICYFAEAAYDTSGIELFERTVIPELRGPGTHPGADERDGHHHVRHHLFGGR